MKKLIKISAVALAVSLATAGHANTVGHTNLVYAKDPVNTFNNPIIRKVNVQLNVLPSVVGYVSGNANIQITPSSAIGIYGGFWSWGNMRIENGKTSYQDGVQQYNVGIQYSYALNGQYMSTGWLVKPFIGYTKITVDNTVSEGESYGAMIDHQWVFNNGLMIQVGMGPRYLALQHDITKTNGFNIAGETNIGYAF